MNQKILLFLTLIGLTAVLSPFAQAADYHCDGGHDFWSETRNWDLSGVPNSIDDGVYYKNAAYRAIKVDSDTNYTINGLHHNQSGNNTWVINAGNAASSLTFATTNGPATIYYYSDGSNDTQLELNVSLILGSDLQVVNNVPSEKNKYKQIRISGDITGTGNILSTVRLNSTKAKKSHNEFGNVSNNGTFTLGRSDPWITSVAGRTISTNIANSGTTHVNGILACTEGVFVTSGTLNLKGANTYTGGTSITGGRINVYDDGTLGKGNVTVGEFGKLNIQTNSVFAVNAVLTVAPAATPRVELDAGTTNLVGSLILDETAYTASGTYGSTASGAEYVFNDYFTGTGVLTLDASRNATLIIFR